MGGRLPVRPLAVPVALEPADGRARDSDSESEFVGQIVTQGPQQWHLQLEGSESQPSPGCISKHTFN